MPAQLEIIAVKTAAKSPVLGRTQKATGWVILRGPSRNSSSSSSAESVAISSLYRRLSSANIDFSSTSAIVGTLSAILL